MPCQALLAVVPAVCCGLLLLASTPLPGQEERLTVHAKPAPLPEGAVVEPWPRFLGPHDNGKSKETGLRERWPDSGPALLWELRKGEGYTTPAVADGRLFLFHRLDGRERIESRHPETGAPIWETSYEVDYRDSFGYADGPRSSPVIDGDRVYTLGVTSVLTCSRVASGKVAWRRDLMAEYDVPQYFFGTGTSPLVVGDLLIVNVGGGEAGRDERETVIAFDKRSGETKWITRSPWGASYASPMLETFHGKPRVLVFAGGKSDPPTGGLLLLDPQDGRIIDRLPWRSNKIASVNAASPVTVGNRVFITESYSVGGICLEVTKEPEGFREVWRAPNFASHWCTPIHHEGYLYGFDGEKSHLAQLVCYDWESGKEQWREDLRWDEEVDGRKMIAGAFRGSLMHVQDRFLCLGEDGALLWLDLTPQGCEVLQRTRLFRATQTWSAPAVHRGLVYISQHYKDFRGDGEPRLLCYDFRAPSTP